MQAEAGFLGEIELAATALPDSSFGVFEQLPNIAGIHRLAHEFSQHLELMPYQKVGESPRLLVSVYVESSQTRGRIIAVLVRDKFPKTWDDLASLVHTAQQRIAALTLLEKQITSQSIAAASQALADLSGRLKGETG